MGMASRIAARWGDANRQYMETQREASDVAGGLGAISKIFRMVLQSAVLAVGAWLVIIRQATAGIIIAGSILSARALAPVDLAIANWKSFVAARQSWKRLNELLAHSARNAPSRWRWQPPQEFDRGRERSARCRPAIRRSSCRTFSSRCRPATGSASSGRADRANPRWRALLVGVWQPVRGKIRLDGAALDQWTPETLGPHIGYLPQDVELLSGNDRAEHRAASRTTPEPKTCSRRRKRPACTI